MAAAKAGAQQQKGNDTFSSTASAIAMSRSSTRRERINAYIHICYTRRVLSSLLQTEVFLSNYN